MASQYYIISSEHARRIGVTEFRHGGTEGYVVTSGDLATAPRDIRDAAMAVTENEALEFIDSIK